MNGILPEMERLEVQQKTFPVGCSVGAPKDQYRAIVLNRSRVFLGALLATSRVPRCFDCTYPAKGFEALRLLNLLQYAVDGSRRNGDVAALATAMHRLLDDRDSAQRFGRRAAEEVIDKWHIDATYGAYAALYEETLADPA